MKRIAIIGGGISGLTAAYELELARQRDAAIDWHLYEASNRLGGIIETTRHATPEGEFILEGGPDGWVSEKPWARELAIELGLESELIYSNDATRKTWILINNKLQPIPDRMRMMVPEDLSALDNSPLFSESAKQAYANELTRAEELKAQAPAHDESVADFVRRHFGDEVLNTLAAPLLSGVFGGDVHKLSARAVMPQFVAMEHEHGSLILALQSKRRTGQTQPLFTSLRNGMASLTETLVSKLPSDRLHLRSCSYPYKYGERWLVGTGENVRLSRSSGNSEVTFVQLILATPLDWTRRMLPNSAEKVMLPNEASSAVLAAFAWSPDLARTFTIPPGFGFLVPQSSANEDQLLACTFVDQKFPHRASSGARILRAFFGGRCGKDLCTESSEAIALATLSQLRSILGPIPDPTFHSVCRWPRSLPQYEVGHLDRIAELDRLISQTPGLHLLGNAYRGVGLPDLIRDARATARAIADD